MKEKTIIKGFVKAVIRNTETGKTRLVFTDNLDKQQAEEVLKAKGFKSNLTPNAYFDDLKTEHLSGGSLEIDFTLISTEYDPPTKTSALPASFATVAPDSITDNGDRLTIVTTFPAGTGTTNDTTIAVATSSTIFDVASATGLVIDDRIEIVGDSGATKQQRKIAGLSGVTVTLDKAVTFTTAISDPVNQKISTAHLLYNTTEPLSSAALVTSKTSIDELIITHEIFFI